MAKKYAEGSGQRSTRPLTARTLHLPDISSRFPIGNYLNPPSESHVIQEGHALLRQFVQEELSRNAERESEVTESEIQEVESMLETASSEVLQEVLPHDEIDGTSASHYETESALHSYPKWKQTGDTLRKVADDFAQSPHRKLVRQCANNLDVNNISETDFFEMMEALFLGGFSRERLVALFFFCSDLILKLVERKLQAIKMKIVNWILRFFVQIVSKWVKEKGGWEVVLFDYMPRLVLMATGIAVTLGIGFYVWKNWE